MHTILDANAVTCITALVLFAVATAGVKGFALMLLIGTVVSLVTAVAATRAMLGLLAGFKWFDNPRFMGATAQEIPRWQRIDVVGRRRLWFIALASSRSCVSVLALAVQGLNLGIDFKGGIAGHVHDAEADVARGRARPESPTDGARRPGPRHATGGDAYRSFQIRLKSSTPAEQAQLTTDLTDSSAPRRSA